MNGKKLLMILIVSLVLAALLLTGCGAVNAKTEKPVETELTEMKDTNTNSGTTQTLDDFIYLFRDLGGNTEACKKQSFDDVVTLYAVENKVVNQKMWLYDAKRGTMFYNSHAPYREYMPCDYRYAYDLTAADKKALSAALKTAGVHDWDETFRADDAGSGTVSWKIVLEYKDGTFETHTSVGYCARSWDGFHTLIDFLASFPYTDNPLKTIR